MSQKKHVIFKIGTSTLTKGTKNLSRRFMLELVRQAAQLYEMGHHLIFVSSGAGAAGREILNQPKQIRSMPFKQMLASVGQVRLMEIWSELFGLYNIPVGQILLTRSDFSNRQRYLNARDTLQALLHHRVVPIINENDTVATEEIKVGDNDNLSALVANLVAADLLVLLTDQQGLFTADPRSNPTATLIPMVEKIDASILALAGDSKSGLGTGGMMTKLQAAQLATQGGTATVIASSFIPDVMLHVVEGKSVGTLFKAQGNPRESRKRWLLSEKPQGILTLDSGAASKVSKNGASLLAVGIKEIEKTFERGAVVHLVSPTGQHIAAGLTNYSSQEITKLIGKKTDQIEECLGYTCGNEIVHRDNMIVLEPTHE
jgi:glutamate 5-kinase